MAILHDEWCQIYRKSSGDKGSATVTASDQRSSLTARREPLLSASSRRTHARMQESFLAIGKSNRILGCNYSFTIDLASYVLQHCHRYMVVLSMPSNTSLFGWRIKIFSAELRSDRAILNYIQLFRCRMNS